MSYLEFGSHGQSPYLRTAILESIQAKDPLLIQTSIDAASGTNLTCEITAGITVLKLLKEREASELELQRLRQSRNEERSNRVRLERRVHAFENSVTDALSELDQDSSCTQLPSIKPKRVQHQHNSKLVLTVEERQRWIEANKRLRLNAISNREDYAQFASRKEVQERKLEASSNLRLDALVASEVPSTVKIGPSLHQLKIRHSDVPRQKARRRRLKPIEPRL